MPFSSPPAIIGAMPADSAAALLAAAVRAAILAKAPRRTVQAVASAVTGVLARPMAATAMKGTDARESAGSTCTAKDDSNASPEQLLQSLREARSAQRRRKKERRRARKTATRNADKRQSSDEAAAAAHAHAEAATATPVLTRGGEEEPAASDVNMTLAVTSNVRGLSPASAWLASSPPPSKKSRGNSRNSRSSVGTDASDESLARRAALAEALRPSDTSSECISLTSQGSGRPADSRQQGGPPRHRRGSASGARGGLPAVLELHGK